jgi:predicted nuclease of restriction endonuclease-like (RecB) superfamily
MSSDLQTPHPDYREWLADIKGRYRHVQLKAAVVVNTAVLEFYWDLGADILARQSNTAWGQGFLTQLSADLMNEFPGVAGFSKRNLEQMRRWVSFWSRAPQIAKQPASQLMGIPWWHHVVILTKCKEPDEALYYVQQTQAHGWSRSVLTHQIESGLWQREGQAITNFAQTLPAPHSDLARQVLKDPYVFDFLSLTPEHTERELKTIDFEPEFAGKLNFYLKAVDAQMRQDGDAPTIGLLLCKSKDRLVAEYALSDIQKPMGLSTYTLSHTLPEVLRGKLPSIEQLEQELGKDLDSPEAGGLGYEF